MEFRLELAFNADAEQKRRPFSTTAWLLGLLLLAIPALIYLLGAGILVIRTLTAGASATLLYSAAGLGVVVLVLLLTMPRARQPYRYLIIGENGIRSENGQLEISWATVSSLRLRHDVLSIACTDEDDVQLAVRTPGFEGRELEAFAYACIALAAKQRDNTR